MSAQFTHNFNSSTKNRVIDFASLKTCKPFLVQENGGTREVSMVIVTSLDEDALANVLFFDLGDSRIRYGNIPYLCKSFDYFVTPTPIEIKIVV